MSFVRPEIRRAIWRWREALVCGAALIWVAGLLGRGVERGSLTLTGLALVLVMVLGFLLYQAILRARFAGAQKAPGVVVVSEREIGFLGPDNGSFVSLDDLVRLEIMVFERREQAADIFWSLGHSAGEALLIPLGAEGAEQLYDSFAALRGVRMEEATRAVSAGRSGRFLIWERPH